MFRDMGISTGTLIILLIAGYFVIKWAVKNGICEAYKAITGNDTDEEKKIMEMMSSADTSDASLKTDASYDAEAADLI